MSSSVYFKFKSQKEPTRVEFDGTGISVFELKRDIILKSGLGDGTDFDLAIYSEDGSEEYDDDTTIIPRSTTVIARRLPPIKPGAGRAARYVSGKMPASAKNSSRREHTSKAAKPSTLGLSQMSTAMTEEEKMAAMFQVQSDQWTAQQEEMATHAPVYRPGAKKPANVPDHEPPNGYICYRCGQKGHWIQVCPTNENPDYDNRPRVKRTTGIPRSFLRTVDKATALGSSDEDAKAPSGVMVNAEGEFVVAEPDKASWDKFQAKTQSSAAAAKAATAEDKEMEERGLVCAIDKRVLIDPMKTPCCAKTYCNDCITNALIESDFVCPGCQTEGVLIDDLKPDEEATTKIQEHIKEKAAAKREKSPSPTPATAESPSPTADVKDSTKEEITKTEQSNQTNGTNETENTMEVVNGKKSVSPTPTRTSIKSPPKEPSIKPFTPSTNTPAQDTAQPQNVISKKRSADEVLENPKIPKGPKAMQQAQDKQMQNMMGPGMMGMNGMNGVNGMNGMNGMPMPNMMGWGGMPNMNFNPAMMGGGMGMPNFNMMGMMNPMMGMNGMNGMNGFNGNSGFNMNGNMQGNFGANMNGSGMGMNGGGFNFQNQEFNGQANDEDAYFRKPVNPHRHQNRQRRVRPSDYREL